MRAATALRFDVPAVVSREFRPLEASTGGPLRLRAATAHAVGRGLRFDAPAVVSRESRCVSTLPLWFRANSVGRGHGRGRGRGGGRGAGGGGKILKREYVGVGVEVAATREALHLDQTGLAPGQTTTALRIPSFAAPPSFL